MPFAIPRAFCKLRETLVLHSSPSLALTLVVPAQTATLGESPPFISGDIPNIFIALFPNLGFRSTLNLSLEIWQVEAALLAHDVWGTQPIFILLVDKTVDLHLAVQTADRSEYHDQYIVIF